MNMMELTDYMERYIADRFAVIPGVSRLNAFGSGGPSMRVWLDPLAMAARNLTVSDVEAALRRENLELPAGRVFHHGVNCKGWWVECQATGVGLAWSP